MKTLQQWQESIPNRHTIEHYKTRMDWIFNYCFPAITTECMDELVKFCEDKIGRYQ